MLNMKELLEKVEEYSRLKVKLMVVLLVLVEFG